MFPFILVKLWPGKKGIKLDHIGFCLIRLIFIQLIKYNFESDQIKSNMIIFDHIHFYIDRQNSYYTLLQPIGSY